MQFPQVFDRLRGLKRWKNQQGKNMLSSMASLLKAMKQQKSTFFDKLILIFVQIPISIDLSAETIRDSTCKLRKKVG